MSSRFGSGAPAGVRGLGKMMQAAQALNVFIGLEESQTIQQAFEALGHNALQRGGYEEGLDAKIQHTSNRGRGIIGVERTEN